MVQPRPDVARAATGRRLSECADQWRYRIGGARIATPDAPYIAIARRGRHCPEYGRVTARRLIPLDRVVDVVGG